MELIQQLTVAGVDLLLVLLGDEAYSLPLGVVLRQDIAEVGRQLALQESSQLVEDLTLGGEVLLRSSTGGAMLAPFLATALEEVVEVLAELGPDTLAIALRD